MKKLGSFIIMAILLSALATATELVFDTNNPLSFTFNLLNGSGLWNETAGNLYPYWATDNLQIPTLSNCDTIDTDANGIMSCGSDTVGGFTKGDSISATNINITGIQNVTSNIYLNYATPSQCLQTDANGKITTSGAACSVVDTSSYYNLANFTLNYDARTDRFGIINYSNEYSATGYKKANLTIDYPNLDTDKTDDLDLSALDNNTIIRATNTSWWQNIYDTITSRWQKANTTSYLAENGFIKNINFNLNNISNKTDFNNVLNHPAFSNFQLANVSNNTINRDMLDNATINRSIDLSAYNKSISLNNYNQSISLINYLTRGSLTNNKICTYNSATDNLDCVYTDINTIFDSDTMAIVNLTMLDNSTIIRIGNTSWLLNLLSTNNYQKNSDFNLNNISNNTYKISDNASIKAYIDAQDLTKITSGDFDLRNISNKTDWTNVLNAPASSNFQISNVSNNTLVKGDNTTITENINTKQAEASAFKIVNGTNLPFSNFQTVNVSNTTSISRILDAYLLAKVGDFNLNNISNKTDWINVLNVPLSSNFRIENVSNNTPFTSIQGMPAFSNFQIANLTDANIPDDLTIATTKTLTVNGGITNDGITLAGGNGFFMNIFIENETIPINGMKVNGSWMPSRNNTFNTGDATATWKDGTWEGTIRAGTIYGEIPDAYKTANASNYLILTGYIKGSDFNIGNISNKTDFNNVLNHPAFSNFQIANVSNTTSISRILDAYLLAKVGDFNLNNISNKTDWINVLNAPASSNFQLANISNNTLTKGDNATLAQWNVSGNNIFNKNSGNVGIGTTAPNAKLVVIGGVNISGGLNVTAGDVLLATNSGNVGIGTTNPTEKLQVIGNIAVSGLSGNDIKLYDAGDTNWRIGFSPSGAGNFARNLVTSNSVYIAYAGNTAEGFAIGKQGGNSGFEILGSDSTAYFRGNVGIGTTAPNAKLTVSGLINSTAINTSKISLSSGNKMCFNQNCSVYQCFNSSNAMFMMVNEDSTQVCI